MLRGVRKLLAAVLALLLSLLLASACLPLDEVLVVPGPTAGAPVSTSLPGWVQVYFTDPASATNPANGLDQAVLAELDAAERSIDIASFDLNLPAAVQALGAAHQRGVQVRVVLDGENGSYELKASDSPDGKIFNAWKALKAAGVPVVSGGRSNGLMHDKLILIDQRLLFVGSWNASYNDTYRNNNNLLRLTDPKIIRNYQAKFDELFLDQRFGARAEVGALTPELSLGGILVENYFSPVDGVMAQLVAAIGAARRSIHFMAFTYTHADLAAAMVDRYKAGLEVEGVIENRGASLGALPTLFCAGLPVRTDGNKYTMHHKVIIIDSAAVVTGSFNFTKSADEVNDDNLLVIHDPQLAAQYEREFERVYALGKTPEKTEIDCDQKK
jgi:phosphatidylserine/phosphatidylglycerophosphate/cardiolipin synthase-like enzyme